MSLWTIFSVWSNQETIGDQNVRATAKIHESLISGSIWWLKLRIKNIAACLSVRWVFFNLASSYNLTAQPRNVVKQEGLEIEQSLLKMGSDKIIYWLLGFIMLKKRERLRIELLITIKITSLLGFLNMIKPRRKEHLPSQWIIISEPVFRYDHRWAKL